MAHPPSPDHTTNLTNKFTLIQGSLSNMPILKPYWENKWSQLCSQMKELTIQLNWKRNYTYSQFTAPSAASSGSPALIYDTTWLMLYSHYTNPLDGVDMCIDTTNCIHVHLCSADQLDPLKLSLCQSSYSSRRLLAWATNTCHKYLPASAMYSTVCCTFINTSRHRANLHAALQVSAASTHLLST